MLPRVEKKAPSVPDYTPRDVRLSNVHVVLVLPKNFPYLEGGKIRGLIARQRILNTNAKRFSLNTRSGGTLFNRQARMFPLS